MESHAATVTLYDGLGSDRVRKVTMNEIKSRFFLLGLRAGAALQMFLVLLALVLSSTDVMQRLSQLYYPLFRALFLLSLFGVLFGLLLLSLIHI